MPSFRLLHGEIARVELPDGFDFRPWKRFHWLERLAKRIWMRLAQERKNFSKMYKTVEVSEDHIEKLILRSQDNIEMIWRREAKHVVMGFSQFNALGDYLYHSGLSFGMDVRIGHGRKIELRGLTVHIIPWFDGVLLLPDLETKASERKERR